MGLEPGKDVCMQNMVDNIIRNAQERGLIMVKIIEKEFSKIEQKKYDKNNKEYINKLLNYYYYKQLKIN